MCINLSRRNQITEWSIRKPHIINLYDINIQINNGRAILPPQYCKQRVTTVTSGLTDKYASEKVRGFGNRAVDSFTRVE